MGHWSCLLLTITSQGPVMCITPYYNETSMSKSMFVKKTFLQSIFVGSQTWKCQSYNTDYNMQIM